MKTLPALCVLDAAVVMSFFVSGRAVQLFWIECIILSDSRDHILTELSMPPETKRLPSGCHPQPPTAHSPVRAASPPPSLPPATAAEDGVWAPRAAGVGEDGNEPLGHQVCERRRHTQHATRPRTCAHAHAVCTCMCGMWYAQVRELSRRMEAAEEILAAVDAERATAVDGGISPALKEVKGRVSIQPPLP